MKSTRGCWAEVNLNDIVHNANLVKDYIKKSSDKVDTFMPVIKASGYGLGIAEISKALYESDNDYYFAVATLSEALIIRAVLKNARIIIISHTPEYLIEEAVSNNITLTISSYEQAEHINKIAKELNCKATIHIKLDTGMRRIGFSCIDENVPVIANIFALENLYVEGLFTHFATAYWHEKDYVHIQYNTYKTFRDKLTAAGLTFSIYHITNTGIILDNPEYHENGVRFGNMIYGVYSSPYIHRERLIIKEPLSIKAEISHLNHVKAGEGVSYDHLYHTERDSVLAVLGLGWVDLGIRMARNRGHVLVNGVRCKIVGCVCMDQMMIDVTDVPDVKIGQVVTLLGTDHGTFLGVDELAENAGVDTYFFTCSIDRRLPIRYIKDGEIVGVLDVNRVLYEDLLRKNNI